MENLALGHGFGLTIPVIGGYDLSKWRVKMMGPMIILMLRFQLLSWIIFMHQPNGLWHVEMAVSWTKMIIFNFFFD